ncbi:hypothetical protein KFK09_004748 [Dendrobium nobile]|uniref:Acylphosphatase-like domain-containing protein n=1 Tax=Dendrobium nobile TaxID=94219 RepID=A0A8T3BYT1_DENNO|nr:hypothetical protein KFK09_004748 [Dendrobium nobile]
MENAEDLGLRGWVRNRRNGSVEAICSGSPDKGAGSVLLLLPFSNLDMKLCSQFMLTMLCQMQKKIRYCVIDPELEDKLDLMFLGVVATGDHAWTPNQGLHDENVTEDSENIDVKGKKSLVQHF